MSNYIHAITCIIIDMHINKCKFRTRNHWIIPPPKAPSPPNHSKKKHPHDVFSNHHPKNHRISSFSGLSEAGRISLKFWVKRQLKATISTWLGWKVDDWNSEIIPSLKLTAKAPESGPKPKRKQSYSNHPFSGDMLVSERVTLHPGYTNSSPLKIDDWKKFNFLCGWHIFKGLYVSFREGISSFFPNCRDHILMNGAYNVNVRKSLQVWWI